MLSQLSIAFNGYTLIPTHVPVAVNLFESKCFS